MVFSLSMSNSLSLSFISIVSLSLHLSIPTGFQLLHTVLLGSNKKRAEKAIKIYQKTKNKKKHSIEKRRWSRWPYLSLYEFSGKWSFEHRAVWRFLSQKYIQKKLEGQVPWSPNDMHQEKVRRTRGTVLNGVHWPIRNRVVAAFNSRSVLLCELCRTHQD